MYRKCKNALTALAIPILFLLASPVYAEAAQQVFITIFGVVSKIAIGIGVVIGLMGVIHYAAANGDGDGPAKRKAVMEIASGVALLIAGAVVAASAETFATLITL